MASTIYSPLRGDGREFRLLVIKPSPDHLAPLRCELHQASFDDNNLAYTALSYTWGDPLVTAPIVVNGAETQVTLNLEAALRHIRKSSHAITLWVDAICINQDDVAEKNHQVEMMREIFSGAELVIAWLGSASEDSDLAMELLRTGLDEWIESKGIQSIFIEEEGAEGTGTGSSVLNDEGRGHATAGDEDLTTASELVENTKNLQLSDAAAGAISEDTVAFIGVENTQRDKYQITYKPGICPSSRSSSASDVYTPDDWNVVDRIIEGIPRREALATTRLLSRPWWCRIWVVQEVLLAKKVVFKCGDAEVSGERMTRNEEQLWSLFWWMDRDSIDVYRKSLLLLEDLGTQKNKTNTLNFLSLYSTRQATRAHDHIYGLYGIISKDDQILLRAPDYNCEAEDLFVSVATKLMLRYRSLALLHSAARIAPTAAHSTKVHFPSWVSDWTRPHLNGGSSLLNKSKKILEADFHFSENFRELTLKCFEVETIESVKSVPGLAQGRLPIWQNTLETRNDQRSPPLEGVIIALMICFWICEVVPSLGTPEFEFVAAFFQELEEYRIALGGDEASEVHTEAGYLAGLLEWIGERRDGRTEDEVLAKVFTVETAHSFVKWHQRQSTADLQRFYARYSTLRKNSSNISIFRTCKGSFGTSASAEVAPGDIICVVPTCECPLVFREVQPSKHMLIGSCDVMAGMEQEELIQAVEDGEIVKKSFTLV